MRRPDVEAMLRPLKPFQRRTVEHAFTQLFEAPGASARFLVADEVGLGKTLVARGVIAKAIGYYWDSVGRIDMARVRTPISQIFLRVGARERSAIKSLGPGSSPGRRDWVRGREIPDIAGACPGLQSGAIPG